MPLPQQQLKYAVIKWLVCMGLLTSTCTSFADAGLYYSDRPFKIDQLAIESLIIDVQPQMVTSVRECIECEPKVLLFSHDLAERFEWDIYTGLDSHLLLHHSSNYWVLVSLSSDEHRSLISIDKVDAQVRADLELIAIKVKRDLLAAVEQPSL